MTTIPLDTHLTIGGLIYPNMDQCDFTGPFEALARVPNSHFVTIWKDKNPVRDLAGLLLMADTTIAEAPQLDVLLVPGGYGQEALMHDEVVLSFIRKQAAGARFVFSVCTGALLCGAAGLLQGKRATTHWTAMEVLPYFGAAPSDERVVVDGKFISAGGVTSGIDGSLVIVSLLRGESVAQELQLYMAYDPHPPFQAGSPASAPASILSAVTQRAKPITEQRLETARAWQKSQNHDQTEKFMKATTLDSVTTIHPVTPEDKIAMAKLRPMVEPNKGRCRALLPAGLLTKSLVARSPQKT